MVRLRDAYDLVANQVKSCVLGNTQEMHDCLGRRNTTLHLPVAHAFKDLGVAQGRGGESRALIRKRCAIAIQRMKRISGPAAEGEILE